MKLTGLNNSQALNFKAKEKDTDKHKIRNNILMATAGTGIGLLDWKLRMFDKVVKIEKNPTDLTRNARTLYTNGCKSISNQLEKAGGLKGFIEANNAKAAFKHQVKIMPKETRHAFFKVLKSIIKTPEKTIELTEFKKAVTASKVFKDWFFNTAKNGAKKLIIPYAIGGAMFGYGAISIISDVIKATKKTSKKL